MNRLSEESSPYLLLHADNPVEWYPWSAEAIEKARSEDKPIFLSVGYSTCYWCHVMERESFSDPKVAEAMNRDFINIKVDREERPDLDEIYMTATQILNQQGGWPNSVFLTPDLKPFFAGTYFPPEDRHGLPSFSTVLRSLSSAWIERRKDVFEQGDSVAAAMSRALELGDGPSESVPATSLVNRAVQDLRSRFDGSHGGFGGAPKFPNPANLFLLAEVATDANDARSMVERTLLAMARGGICDQLGGGFHRYSTDSEWLVPHFEKMLYDNGLLLEIYARYQERFPDYEVERTLRRTADFLRREMTDPAGGLWSAIDAETEGMEGAYYVWKNQELEEILGAEDAAFLAPILGFSGPPRFEREYQILHLPGPLRDQAARRRLAVDDLMTQVEPLLDRLLEVRSARERPATDDKILSDWNGMAIGGLSAAGRVLGEPGWVDAAAGAAEFVVGELRGNGGLRHSWRAGKVGPRAFLSDYVFLVHGLLELHRATGIDRWLSLAVELTHEQIERLADPAGGYFVAAESEDVLFRSKEVVDGAVPGANSMAILNLVSLYESTRDPVWLDRAQETLRVFGTFAERHPAAFKTFALSLKRYHDAIGGRVEIDATGSDSRWAIDTVEATVGVPLAADLTVSPMAEADRLAFRLHVDVAPGWHVYAPNVENELYPAVRLVGVDVELGSVSFPAGEELPDPAGGQPIAVYKGCFEILGDLRTAGERRGALRLEFQACDENRCLAPSELELPIDR